MRLKVEAFFVALVVGVHFTPTSQSTVRQPTRAGLTDSGTTEAQAEQPTIYSTFGSTRSASAPAEDTAQATFNPTLSRRADPGPHTTCRPRSLRTAAAPADPMFKTATRLRHTRVTADSFLVQRFICYSTAVHDLFTILALTGSSSSSIAASAVHQQ